MQARVLAEWCQGLAAEEALPRLDVVFGDSATELKATVGGKACVCADFDEYMRPVPPPHPPSAVGSASLCGNCIRPFVEGCD